MLVFPNAKINLGLHILKKRDDGYHELETCFYPVEWKDSLELIESETYHFSSSGIEIPGEGHNIVEQAYLALKKDFDLPNVQMHLHKVIPIGAGLGGGSSDAAFALKLINQKFDLKIELEELKKYAVPIGADCAFFIENRPMLARGIGEILNPIDISLKNKHILLIYPGIHISTKEAYAGIHPKVPEVSLEDDLQGRPVDEWHNFVKNDFEESLFPKHPVLQQIKDRLYREGAIYASMSGSGSCMFGIFEESTEIEFGKEYATWSGILKH